MINAPSLLNVTHDERGAVLIVHVIGEVDAFSAPALDCALRAACAKIDVPAGRLVLDLVGVRFMGAAGVHVLSAARQHCDRHGIDLSVVASAAVLHPLRATSHDHLFHLVDTMTEAMAGAGQGP